MYQMRNYIFAGVFSEGGAPSAWCACSATIWVFGRTRNPYFVILGASLLFDSAFLMLLPHRGYLSGTVLIMPTRSVFRGRIPCCLICAH